MNMIKVIDNQKIDLNKEECVCTFTLDKNEEAHLLLTNIKNDQNITFDIPEGAFLHLAILADKAIDKAKILANLALNSQIEVYFADFSNEVNKIDVVINLNESGATANWKLASLSSKNDKKEINVSVFHNAENTFARVDNYGVAKDQSKLLFAGTSHSYIRLILSSMSILVKSNEWS